MSAASAVQFRIGTVLGRGFGVLFRNIVPFGLMAMVFTSPQFVYTLATAEGQVLETDPAGDSSSVESFLTLLSWPLGWILAGALVYGTVRELRGRHASLLECIRGGLAVVFPVAGVAIVTGLAIWLGFVFLIVPGVIVLVMLWVAVPVAVVERPGVFRSLGRSRELTKGNRWRVFGLIVVIGVAVIALFLVFLVFMSSIGFAMLFDPNLTIVVTLIVWLLTAFISALGSVLIAVSYHDLRIAKEGASAEEIAAVFD